jgi:hypothetical protein
MFKIITAIIFSAFGQVLISRHDLRGLIPTALAVVLVLIALWHDHTQFISTDTYAQIPTAYGENRSTAIPARQRHLPKYALLVLAIVNAILAYLGAHDNTYRWYGVLAWGLAIGLFAVAFWDFGSNQIFGLRFRIRLDKARLGWTAAAVVGLLALALFFRFWRLDQMPSEMTSDHIEKLLDVHDLVMGQRPIFFVRNTGREPWQFYWTLGFIRLFGLDTKFFALKLGAAAVSLLTLPGVFLLGRDLFGRWVGLWATLFTAVASWPVILSRIGLRFPFAPAVTAWSLFFLFRGLRAGRRNDFILLGLTLGVGLHGYTAFRAMPLAAAVCWCLVLLFRPKRLSARPSQLLRNAALTVLITIIVFIPLGRFSLEHPDDFWRRSVSRVVDPNHPTPDSPFVTLVKNMWDVALMFHWQGDDVWVNTLSNRPILDPLLGGLLILGLIIALWRGRRDPIPLLVLISGIVLLLPSALSLAYPVENPSAVRTGGAIPVVMVIAALPVGLAMDWGLADLGKNRTRDTDSRSGPGARVRVRWRSILLITGALTLAVSATIINLRRYYVDYWRQYERNAQNTTEIAAAIRGFVESGGSLANAWIIAWPYWIDTRGVGIELGDPPWNNVILKPEELDDQAADIQTDASIQIEASSNSSEDLPRFYVLHTKDVGSLDQLKRLFPQGSTKLVIARHPERSFITFYVPSPHTSWDSKGVSIDAP